MLKRNSRKKKKGILEFSLTEFIGMIFVVAVVFIIVYVMSRYGSLFFASAKIQGTFRNFDAINDRIENGLLKSDANFDADQNFPFYISDKYILVAFPSDEVTSNLKMGVKCGSYEEIVKPPECGTKACMCLWEDTAYNDFKSDFGGKNGLENVERCKQFSNVDYIFTYYYEDYLPYVQAEEESRALDHNMAGDKYDYDKFYYYDGWQKGSQNYAPFIVYGECNNHWTDEVTKPQRLYIEKFVDKQNGNKVSIFIALKSNHTEKRYIELRSKYGKTSPEDYWNDIRIAYLKKEYQKVLDLYITSKKEYSDISISDKTTVETLYSFFTSPSTISLNMKDVSAPAIEFLNAMQKNIFVNLEDSKKLIAQCYIAFYTEDPLEKEGKLIAFISKKDELSNVNDADGQPIRAKAMQLLAELYDKNGKLEDRQKAKQQYQRIIADYASTKIGSVASNRIVEIEKEEQTEAK
jgi:hypothetical protein